MRNSKLTMENEEEKCKLMTSPEKCDLVINLGKLNWPTHVICIFISIIGEMIMVTYKNSFNTNNINKYERAQTKTEFNS